MSGLFGRKGQSTTEQRYNSIQMNQSAYGQPVPLVYGMCRGAGFLMWYGDFVSTPHSQSQGGKGGGGQQSTSYTYTAALAMGLCEGGAAAIGVNNVWHNSTADTLSNLGLTLFTGLTGQAVWSYLTSKHPSQAVPYSGIAFVAATSYQLGSQAGLPNLTYEIQGLVRYNPGTIDDAEPSAVITDYCTDLNHGANFSYLGTLTGANSFQQWCVAQGLFISYNESTQRAAADFIAEVMQITNSAPVTRGDGTLNVVPYCDASVSGNGATYTPNLTPLYAFTDDDFSPKGGEDPVTLIRTPYTQTFNVVNVEYEERANLYNRAIASAYDDNDVALNGTRVMQTVSLPAIKTAAMAKLVAQMILQRQLFYRNQYRFRVRPDYMGLEPMDFVALTDTVIGVNNALCRVLKVDEDEDGGLELTVEEVPVGPATAPSYNWQAGQGYAANHNVAPGAVNTPYIFRLPAGMYSDGSTRLGIAVNGPNNGTWGGCNVWVSFDGTNYEQVGTVVNPARYGTLSATLPSVVDPDTTSTLGVTLNRTDLTMSGGSAADCDQLRTLCIVDGELVSYQAATFVSAGNYNLGTRLRRGRYGSTVAAHSSGANWARLDQAIFTLPLDPGWNNQTLYFKFQSFNIFNAGLESLASDTAYTYVPAVGMVSAGYSAWTVQGSAVVDNNRVFKATGSATLWDSNAYGKGVTGGVWVKARVPNTAAWPATQGFCMLGLTRTPSNVSYVAGDFCIFLDNTSGSPGLVIYEGGGNASGATPIGLGSVQPGDVVEIRYDGRTTYYYWNGTLIWTTRRPVPANVPLYPVVYLEYPESNLYDLEFGTGVNAAQANGQNFLSNGDWQVGTNGPQGLWGDVGANVSNIYIGDGSSALAPVGPHGTSEIIWKFNGGPTAGTNGGAYNPNSGSQSAPYLGGNVAGIDPTKTYRFSCWVLCHGGTAGTPFLYVGLDTGGATIDINGHTTDSNPYWTYGAWSGLTMDKWYLVTGILHGSGTANSAHTGLTGIWDPNTGKRLTTFQGDANGSSVTGGADFQQKVGACGQSIRILGIYYGGTGGSSAQTAYFCKPRFEELTGNEPSLWSLMHPTSNIDSTLGIIAPTGSTVATIAAGSSPFTYTSTSSSITISWSAFSFLRPDGTTQSVSAGSVAATTGLAASTTYWFYPYFDEPSASVKLATAGGTGGNLFAHTSSTDQSAANQMNLFASVPLYKFSGATTASGGGGGGGGGYGCPHPDTLVETVERGVVKAGTLEVGEHLRGPQGPARITTIKRVPTYAWLVVRTKTNGAYQKVVVSEYHKFYDANGEQVRACELRVGMLLTGEHSLHRVTGLTILDSTADAVQLELEEPRTYYTRRGGLLCHNLKP